MCIHLGWFLRCVRLFLGMVLLSVTVPASADYTITDLGANVRPYDISNNGIIAGSDAKASPFVSVVGIAGALQPISSSSLESKANAVNSSGLAVGYNYIDGVQRRAFLREANAGLNNFDATAIEASDVSEFDHIAGTALFNGRRGAFVYNLKNQSIISLPTFGGAEGWANGINNFGAAVGTAQDASGIFMGFTATYGKNSIINLGTLSGFTGSEASAVNDSGHVVGWVSRVPATASIVDSASSKRAFVWVPVTGVTGVQDLGALGTDVGSVANDINNAEHVVGYSVAADGSARAFFHDRQATDVVAIAGNATSLYLGTSNGVYRSDDGGSSIATRSNGLTARDVMALATTSDSQIIYAGTAAGVFKTINGGANWTAVNTGLMFSDITVSPVVEAPRAIRTMAADPGNPATVLAGTSDGVYRTLDGGGTWSLFNFTAGTGNLAVAVNELKAVPGTTTVYAATSSGVYASTFSGAIWDNITGSGLPTSNAVTTVDVAYTLTPVLPATVPPTSTLKITAVYAGTSTGLYKYVIPLTPATATDPPKWDDASGTGSTALPGSRSIRRMRFHAATNTIYAALAGVGIYKATNTAAAVPPATAADAAAATAWTAISKTGLTNLDALALSVTSATPPTLYAGTLSGMFRFVDPTSTSWIPTNNMQDLNALIPGGSGWALRNATAINNAGQIVGWGDVGTESHGFLLTPTEGALTAQLTVVKHLPAPPYQQFVPVNYTITVTNNGPATATSILLTDWLPKDVVLRTTQGAPCTNTDSITLTCRLNNLESGKSHTVTIVVSPNAPDISLNNIARVVANESDPVFSDNTSAVEAKTDKCFIATAAYGSFLDPHVQTLRHFRDEYLLTHAAGRAFVEWYYRVSPPLAAFIAQHDSARIITRLFLTPVVYTVKYPILAVVMMLLMVAGISRWRRSRAVGMAQALSHSV